MDFIRKQRDLIYECLVTSYPFVSPVPKGYFLFLRLLLVVLNHFSSNTATFSNLSVNTLCQSYTQINWFDLCLELSRDFSLGDNYFRLLLANQRYNDRGCNFNVGRYSSTTQLFWLVVLVSSVYRNIAWIYVQCVSSISSVYFIDPECSWERELEYRSSAKSPWICWIIFETMQQVAMKLELS